MQTPEMQIAANRETVPFLSEPWYCCAEPTKDQLVSIGAVAKKASEPVAVADGFV
jgi:hypothetical protein